MPFEKGVAANPTGANQHSKPRKKPDIRAWCKRHTFEAYRVVRTIYLDSETSNADKLKAVGMLTDRAEGKPEAAQGAVQGLFAGATIHVDTGIRRTVEPPTINGESHAVDAPQDTPDKADG